jgi:molybdopterin molybdotransferase
MLPVKDAENIILNLVNPLQGSPNRETVNLLTASGRILAETVTSSLDFPHWDNSAMDGYAVRFADVENCSPENPVILDIIEEIPAGYQPKCTIKSGETARIFTGAVMPKGADTIVIQEETRRERDRVLIFTSPQPKAFVRYQGEYYHQGNPLLTPGIILNAPEIAILAAAKCTEIPVYRRLRVTILATGDELVSPDKPLQPSQIVDSNSYALASALISMGIEPIMLGIIPDQKSLLKEAISQAISLGDVVLSTGGVSVGDYDYIEEILSSLGGTIHIKSVAVKPGKPLTVATFNNEKSTLYFGLPGNPVSTLVTFWRFVQPALRKMSGMISELWNPVFVKARSRFDLKSDGKRENYVWGKLQLVDGMYEFDLAGGSQSSGNLINLAQTTGLGMLPIGQKLIPQGEWVQVLKLS